MAMNPAHEGVHKRGRKMLAGANKPNDLLANNLEIERLRFELAEFNRSIDQVENQHPEPSKIEELRTSAQSLARQIDNLRRAKQMN